MVILAILASLVTSARANPATAGQLHEWCHADQRMCMMYVMGVVEGMVAAKDPRIMCMPGDWSYKQITGFVDDAMGAAFKDQPSLKNELAVSAVSELVAAAAKCEAKGQGNDH